MRRASRTCWRASSPLRCCSAWYEAIPPYNAAKTPAKIHSDTATSTSRGSANHRGRSLRRRRFCISRCFRLGGAGHRSNDRFNCSSKSSMGSNSTRVLLFANVLFQMDCGLGPEQLQAPLQVAFDRGQRRIERSRNLLRRHVLLVAENQRRALRFGKRRQQAFQAGAQRRCSGLKLKAVMLFYLDPQVHLPHLAPPQRIRRAAYGHAAQPETGVCGRFNLAQMPVELQKDILRNLLGQTAVAGHAQGERKDHRLVLVHELFKVRLPAVGHGVRFYSLIRINAETGMQRVRYQVNKVAAAAHKKAGARWLRPWW